MAESANERAVHVIVGGRVQGVGFRYFVEAHAIRLGIIGYVRNLSDGRVEARLQGTSAAIEEMLEQIRRGPALSRVDEMNAEPAAVSSAFLTFSVRH